MKHLLKLTLMSVLLSIANQSFAQEGKDIFKHIVGDCEVILLSDGQSTGKVDILLGTTASMLEECISDGTFPNAYNAFLVKIEGKNILIDTGTGAKLFRNLGNSQHKSFTDRCRFNNTHAWRPHRRITARRTSNVFKCRYLYRTIGT